MFLSLFIIYNGFFLLLLYQMVYVLCVYNKKEKYHRITVCKKLFCLLLYNYFLLLPYKNWDLCLLSRWCYCAFVYHIFSRKVCYSVSVSFLWYLWHFSFTWVIAHIIEIILMKAMEFGCIIWNSNVQTLFLLS